MNRPVVIGLLLNFRDAGRSIACAESLFAQGVDHVLVWDNSDDAGISAGNITKEFANDGRVRVHVCSSNLGFAAGVNAALSLCSEWLPGAWVLLINNDAQLLRDGAIKLVAALQSKPEAKLAFPAINHAGHVVGRAFYQYWTGVLSWSSKPGCFTYPSGCCMLVAMDRVDFPLFDEDFFMYGEDWELGWRLRNQQQALLYLDEVLVMHEGSASARLGSPFYEERLVAAHLILVKKMAEGSQLRQGALYLSRIAMLLARASIRSLRFRSFVPWLALRGGWKIAFPPEG